MHRVELKVFDAYRFLHSSSTFLMHRVELKEDVQKIIRNFEKDFEKFLMHRVELKDGGSYTWTDWAAVRS